MASGRQDILVARVESSMFSMCVCVCVQLRIVILFNVTTAKDPNGNETFTDKSKWITFQFESKTGVFHLSPLIGEKL